jgi:hypothetical protein
VPIYLGEVTGKLPLTLIKNERPLSGQRRREKQGEHVPSVVVEVAPSKKRYRRDIERQPSEGERPSFTQRGDGAPVASQAIDKSREDEIEDLSA